MKRLLPQAGHYHYAALCWLLACSFLFSGCLKTAHFPQRGEKDADRFSADVIDQWITMQVRLERNAVGIPNPAFLRYYGYSGIAAFEALAPGTELGGAFSGKWNQIPALPGRDKGESYYWPASVNAALASMNRQIFTTATLTDKAAIDSLENALNASFPQQAGPAVIDRSIAFGKAVASVVFNWSETDGYKNAGDPYTPPSGPGLWQPTPPAFGKASVPYWGNLRPIVAGSTDHTQPGAPIAYSEDPASPFYKMVKQVYDISQNLTQDQINWALFWRDIPGVSTGGHWVSILQQVLRQTHCPLDRAAFAYALTGACINDAGISTFKTKYTYNLVRPITYIRNVMGYSAWNPVLTTPAHPEYSSAHAVVSAATAEAFTALFGNIGSFTDHTYDYLGFPPRTFNSFRAIGEDAGNSRIYAGIHYQPSIDTGLLQGRKVAANILARLYGDTRKW